MLMKATSDDDKPLPGYVYNEVASILFLFELLKAKEKETVTVVFILFSLHFLNVCNSFNFRTVLLK